MQQKPVDAPLSFWALLKTVPKDAVFFICSPDKELSEADKLEPLPNSITAFIGRWLALGCPAMLKVNILSEGKGFIGMVKVQLVAEAL